MKKKTKKKELPVFKVLISEGIMYGVENIVMTDKPIKEWKAIK